MKNYFGAFFIIILCTISGKIFDKIFIPTDQIMIYLIGALIVASRFDKGPSILFSFLSVVAFNFFFIEPIHTFAVADKNYWLTFAVMLATSLFIVTQITKSRKRQIENENEKMRNILLSSISHDLRTPLAAIVGASETIAQNFDKLKKESIIELSKSINNEAERLTKIVKNSLDITSLESRKIKLHKQEYFIQEIIGAAILHLKDSLKNHQVNVNCEENLPMVVVDGVLIEQLIINLLENAAKYTPTNSTINITVKKLENNLLVEIFDNGTGINEKLQKGYGLGLAICRAILKIHNSSLKIINSKSGLHLSFILPEIISLKK